jgi:hypothetical protein
MASDEQVSNDYEEPGDSTNGGPILGVDSTSNQTIEPKTNIPDESSFGALPPEIRNRIYLYASVKPTRIHLAAAFKKQRYKWHDNPTTSKLSGFGVPSIAQTNKQFRRECLGVYYGMNKFVFLFNARSQRSEKVCRRSLRDMIDIIGRSVKMMQPKALEVRFTSTRRMDAASLRSILACFVLMHLNGVRRDKDPNSRIIKATTAGRALKQSAPIAGVTRLLYRLGRRLSVTGCICGAHACRIGINGELIEGRKKSMFVCSESSDQADSEIDRWIFCQKGQSKYLMVPDVHKFMTKLGLKRPEVRICEIIRLSSRHDS